MRKNRNIIFIMILVMLILPGCPKTTKPFDEEIHVCCGNYDIVHGAIRIGLRSSLNENEIEKFILDYSEYDLRIANSTLSAQYPRYWAFDSTKIHCLLFGLLISNDKRTELSATGLMWQSRPTTWTPGYLRIYFDTYMCDELIDELINEIITNYEEYDLKLYNVLIPRLKMYLFSYDYNKMANLYDILNAENYLFAEEDIYDYYKIIDPIGN